MREVENQVVSEDSIKKYLNDVLLCIKLSNYRIDNNNRQKNRAFQRTYSITNEDYIDLINMLSPTNFSTSTRNYKHGFQNEILYIFKLETQLFNSVTFEYDHVTLYIKTNLIEKPILFCIFISIHIADPQKEFN
ncbi:hypothetical protein KZO01_19910 [Kurthia zopfii]|nr:hypothetical protein [Kurthia zopfii]GEK31682.1 hypothetical protein KZO01_19910 [Kurthia zopfii]